MDESENEPFAVARPPDFHSNELKPLVRSWAHLVKTVEYILPGEKLQSFWAEEAVCARDKWWLKQRLPWRHFGSAEWSKCWDVCFCDDCVILASGVSVEAA